jgi:hypothetical protein
MSLPDWMELAEPETSSSPMAKRAPSSLAKDGFAAAEEVLHGEAIVILRDTFAAREIAPGEKEPPQAWIDELGREAAEARLRLANAGWMPTKEAPAFVQTARAFAVGRMKSEATKKGGNRTLNVQFVQLAVGAQPAFEELEVERK